MKEMMFPQLKPSRAQANSCVSETVHFLRDKHGEIEHVAILYSNSHGKHVAGYSASAIGKN